MERVISPSQKIIRFITRNAIVAAMYYAFTMLMVFFPVISQFGPMQCRFSEILVLLAFFDPSLTFGLTLGCFFANLTGFLAGQGFAFDILFGTMATLIACLLEGYFSRFLFVAAIWPVVINGLIVGAEIYFLFNDSGIPLVACMGWVALGELVALTLGYIIFIIIAQNKNVLRLMGATRHLDVKF